MAHHHHQCHHHEVNESNKTRVLIAAFITGIFLVVEVVGGIMSGSLALLADAAHMFVDLFSLLLAYFGFRFATQEADGKRQFGFGRLPVLTAFANGILLAVLCIWVIYEAIERMVIGEYSIDPKLMLYVAVGGFVANVLSYFVLSTGQSHHNLNMRGAILHVFNDLLGSVAAIAAALTMLFALGRSEIDGLISNKSEFFPAGIDPILSICIGLLMLVSAWSLIKSAGHILMEGIPEGIDPDAIREGIAQKFDDVSVNELRVWSINEDSNVANVKVQMASDDVNRTVEGIKLFLEEYEIQQANVEVEIRS